MDGEDTMRSTGCHVHRSLANRPISVAQEQLNHTIICQGTQGSSLYETERIFFVLDFADSQIAEHKMTVFAFTDHDFRQIVDIFDFPLRIQKVIDDVIVDL